MQQLTAPPRSGFTQAQILAVLNGPGVTIDGGLELLDQNNNLITDISANYRLTNSKVERDCAADVQGTCTLHLSQSLNWGSARVRPYMLLTAGGVTCRWDLGVYVLTTPTQVVGASLVEYEVQGYDLNYLMQGIVGDSYAAAAGTNVLAAVQSVITASGCNGTLLADASASSSVLQAPMTFPFDDSDQSSFLDIANQLLAAVSYRPLWVDQDGNFRATPAVPLAVAPVEHTFTADDPLLAAVGQSRTLTNDLWGAPNKWIFTNTSMSDVPDGDGGTAPQVPTAGNGIYTFANADNGPSSIASLGFVRRAAYFIDAADQPSLVAAAQIQIAADQQVTWSVDTTTTVWPCAGHYDTYQLLDSDLGGSFKVQAVKWSMPLDGGDTAWTWQGAA